MLREGPGTQSPGPLCFEIAERPIVRSRNGKPMIVEVESNDNCPDGFFARFKEAGRARPVNQVRLYDRNPAGEWYWVTGWSDDAERPWCQAYGQRVEDSGSGLAHLVYGGIYGLRLKPLPDDEPWNLASRQQWGETHLLLSSDRDLRYSDAASARGGAD